MNRQLLRRAQRGQGLAEYALTIILVGVVSIAILFLLGQAVNRVYGLLAGATGTTHTTSGITFTEPPKCYVVYPGPPKGDGYDSFRPAGTVGMWVVGKLFGGMQRSDLQISTDTGFADTITADASRDFIYNSQLGLPGVAKCPTSVVVQGNGQTATAPLQKIEVP